MLPNKKLTLKCTVAKLYHKPYMGWMLEKDWAVQEGYVWKRYELKTMPFNMEALKYAPPNHPMESRT